MPKGAVARDLLDGLNSRGLLEYGSAIPTTLVHELLGLEMPEQAPKAVYDRLAMAELAAIDFCRNALLSQGKYLAGTSTGYRVLLPSENKGQIDSYMASADRKLSRALRLSRSTPVTAGVRSDQTEVRIHMKKQHLQDAR